jgi:hypothetical protein
MDESQRRGIDAIPEAAAIHRSIDMEAKGYGAYLDQVWDAR